MAVPKYLKQLYGDTNVKSDTIFKYIKILEEKTNKAIEENIEFIKLYEEVYTILQKTKSVATPPAMDGVNFATPVHQSSLSDIELQNANAKIQQLKQKIIEQTPLIEYNFKELLKNMQFLAQSYQNYQQLITDIITAWQNATLSE